MNLKKFVGAVFAATMMFSVFGVVNVFATNYTSEDLEITIYESSVEDESETYTGEDVSVKLLSPSKSDDGGNPEGQEGQVVDNEEDIYYLVLAIAKNNKIDKIDVAGSDSVSVTQEINTVYTGITLKSSDQVDGNTIDNGVYKISDNFLYAFEVKVEKTEGEEVGGDEVTEALVEEGEDPLVLALSKNLTITVTTSGTSEGDSGVTGDNGEGGSTGGGDEGNGEDGGTDGDGGEAD